jgi:hypothetical protein
MIAQNIFLNRHKENLFRPGIQHQEHSKDCNYDNQSNKCNFGSHSTID